MYRPADEDGLVAPLGDEVLALAHLGPLIISNHVC